MKIGTQVYTYKKDGSISTGVIVSKALRWNPFPFNEYIVRETKDLGSVGIAGVLTAAFSGNPESLSMHERSTLYRVAPATTEVVQSEESA